MPVLAPEGTAARPSVPSARITSTSTVGLPRLSRISRPRTAAIGAGCVLIVASSSSRSRSVTQVGIVPSRRRSRRSGPVHGRGSGDPAVGDRRVERRSVRIGDRPWRRSSGEAVRPVGVGTGASVTMGSRDSRRNDRAEPGGDRTGEVEREAVPPLRCRKGRRVVSCLHRERRRPPRGAASRVPVLEDADPSIGESARAGAPSDRGAAARTLSVVGRAIGRVGVVTSDPGPSAGVGGVSGRPSPGH